MKKQFWMVQVASVGIPAGIIVPFNGDVVDIPITFEQFTAAADKSIKAVSSGAGLTGGITSKLLGNSSTRSSHWGTAMKMSYICPCCAASNTGYVQGAKAAGDHSHSVSLNYLPEREKMILVKAKEEMAALPANTGLLSLVDRSELTNITPTNDSLLVGSSDTTKGSLSAETSLSMGTGGGHKHQYMSGCVYGSNWSGSKHNYLNTGYHAHNGNITLEEDRIKRFHLNLYTDALKDIKADEGTVGMWESDTPPDGWQICTDLVDHFIGFDTSKLNTSTGDGMVVTGDKTLPTGGSHNHINGSSTSPYYDSARHSTGEGHSHTLGSYTTEFEPEHYTLVFIKPQ